MARVKAEFDGAELLIVAAGLIALYVFARRRKERRSAPKLRPWRTGRRNRRSKTARRRSRLTVRRKKD